MALPAASSRLQEEPWPPGKRLRNQLAAAVRSINWSYAIFWSVSSTHPGKPHLPRKLTILSDGIGTTVRIFIRGFIDLNTPPLPPTPTPPSSPTTQQASSSEETVSKTLSSSSDSDNDSLPEYAFPSNLTLENPLSPAHSNFISSTNNTMSEQMKSPDFIPLSPHNQVSKMQVNQDKIIREVLDKITIDKVTPSPLKLKGVMIESPVMLLPRQLNFSAVPMQQLEQDITMINITAENKNTPALMQQQELGNGMASLEPGDVDDTMNPTQEQQQEEPRRSTRISKQTKGMYINMVEKAMKKKERQQAVLEQKKRKKARRGDASTSIATEEPNDAAGSPPPLLTAAQMLELGREMGFDEAEEGEIREAAASVLDE